MEYTAELIPSGVDPWLWGKGVAHRTISMARLLKR